MTLSPTTETPRRRLIVVGVVALASISLALLAGYVLLAAPQRILASQGAPEPVTLGGRVVDPAGKPLRGASVMVGSLLVQTDAEGRYTIGPLGIDRSALVRMPGYAKERLALEGKDQTVTLRPHPIKAAYLTYYGIADKGIRERVFDLLGRTELNAVVIDVKGDRGLIPYRTQVPAARWASGSPSGIAIAGSRPSSRESKTNHEGIRPGSAAISRPKRS